MINSKLGKPSEYLISEISESIDETEERIDILQKKIDSCRLDGLIDDALFITLKLDGLMSMTIGGMYFSETSEERTEFRNEINKQSKRFKNLVKDLESDCLCARK